MLKRWICFPFVILAILSLVFALECLQDAPVTGTLQGKQLQGLPLNASTEAGRRLKMRIERVEPDPEDPEREVYLYSVVYRESASRDWQPLCLPDRAGGTQAMALRGRWNAHGDYLDEENLTFACTNGALAKCVRLGYKPWKKVQGRSLREFHQACTRLIRADYLGNGRSYTQEGTLVEVYDVLGIRRRRSLPGSGMVFEAAWSPRGATCMHRTRLGESVRPWVEQCRTNRLCAPSACMDATQALRDNPESLLFVHSFVRTQPKPPVRSSVPTRSPQ